MTLAEYSVRRRVTVVMFTWGAILLGLIAFTRLPQELFPPIAFPQITVVTEYPNAAPEEIETLVARPLEEAVGSVVGLKRIESVSQEGRSTIIVSFDWGQDIDFAALAVREKIDLVKERLPKECEDPVVLKFDPLSRPILILSVSGQMKAATLKTQTERILKDNLEKVEGVASVTMSGGVDREILVEIDQPRLSASNLSILEVVESLEKANVSYPAGGIKKGLYEYLIRTVGEFQSVRDIAFAVVGTESFQRMRPEERSEFVERAAIGPRKTVDVLREELGRDIERKRLVLTKDVAEVKDSFTEVTSISRYKGKENISLSIQKQAGANTIQVVDRVKKATALLREELGIRKIKAEIIYDHSLFIRKSLRGLLDEALQGGALAFAVLYFFIRSFSVALIVTSAIPITVTTIFFLMQLQGITVNIMSLGGLALGIGMMVDQGIVVMENIYRLRMGGSTPEEGAIKGTNEVFWPIFSSTLTSVAVFFPLILFVPGVAGQLFKDLSWTVIYAQVISLLVSVTVITMLSTRVKPAATAYKSIDWLKGLENYLIRLGEPVKQNRVLRMILVAAVATAVAGALLMRFLDKEVLPKVDQGQFLVRIDLPIGTRLEVTNEIVTVVEEVLLKMKEVESTAVTIGSARAKREEVKVETLRSSQGMILVDLKKRRRKSSATVVEELRRELKGYNLRGARVEVALQESEFQFIGAGVKPIQIEVKGYEYEKTVPMAELIRTRLAEIPGVVEIHSDMGQASPETKLEIDKKRAALYGISALDISLTAKAAIDGVVATTYRERGREYDVRVQLSEKDRGKIENLGDLLLYSEVLDTMLPLKEVADMTQGLGPSEIRRKDQQRTITVSADIQKGYKQAAALVRVQAMLKGLEIPEEYQVLLSGQAREVRESFRKVYFALVLSIVLIYMIMASQFESLIQPLLIMITVPLSIIGISLALFLTGTSLNVISLLGMVMLGGVVVNNGIVLMEYINQRRAEGVPLVEAAFESSKVRTRPIIMSALTSSIGLIPIALGLGEGSELRAPLAITTIGGLLSSTFLTLVVLPCFYILASRITEKFLGVEVEERLSPEGERHGTP